MVKAFVGNKLIDQNCFLFLQTESKKPNQIHVLKFWHKNSFVLQLSYPFTGLFRQSLYSHFNSIWKRNLHTIEQNEPSLLFISHNL